MSYPTAYMIHPRLHALLSGRFYFLVVVVHGRIDTAVCIVVFVIYAPEFVVNLFGESVKVSNVVLNAFVSSTDGSGESVGS